MEALYYLSILSIIGVLTVGTVGVINPKVLQKPLKKFATRKYIVLGSVALFFLLSGVVGASEPASLKLARETKAATTQQAKQAEQDQKNKEAAEAEIARNKVTTKEVTETQSVAFSEETKNDNKLTKGQTKVIRDGQNGEKTITYTVTYRGDQVVDRTIKQEAVTKQPVSKVTSVGTYEAPKSSSSGNGYTNSQGNHVPSPGSDPSGASAKCRDGTYSYSQSRRGTCSHHGGVAQWL